MNDIDPLGSIRSLRHKRDTMRTGEDLDEKRRRCDCEEEEEEFFTGAQSWLLNFGVYFRIYSFPVKYLSFMAHSYLLRDD